MTRAPPRPEPEGARPLQPTSPAFTDRHPVPKNHTGDDDVSPALNKVLNLPEGATRAQALAAMTGHVLAEAQLMGTYHR